MCVKFVNVTSELRSIYGQLGMVSDAEMGSLDVDHDKTRSCHRREMDALRIIKNTGTNSTDITEQSGFWENRLGWCLVLLGRF